MLAGTPIRICRGEGLPRMCAWESQGRSDLSMEAEVTETSNGLSVVVSDIHVLESASGLMGICRDACQTSSSDESCQTSSCPGAMRKREPGGR
jgi:hypothetical protein